MKILRTTRDIFTIPNGPTTAVCVTTNGMTKKDGSAVMGAGIAKQANLLFNLAPRLGGFLRVYGNRVFDMGYFYLRDHKYHVITFPTKHDWRDDSNIDLIMASCYQLVELCNKRGYTDVYLTPPGCANGHLDWEKQVRPVVAHILDDRFTVVIR